MNKNYLPILASVTQALSKPKQKIAFMCADDDSARRNMRTCFEVVTPLLGDGDAKLFHLRREIRFSNDSVISFVVAKAD